MSKKWRHRTNKYDIKPNEYAERTWCYNCREKIHIFIKKGILIEDVMPEVDCLNCGGLQGNSQNKPKED